MLSAPLPVVVSGVAWSATVTSSALSAWRFCGAFEHHSSCMFVFGTVTASIACLLLYEDRDYMYVHLEML